MNKLLAALIAAAFATTGAFAATDASRLPLPSPPKPPSRLLPLRPPRRPMEKAPAKKEEAKK
jgi:hypothetical protein